MSDIHIKGLNGIRTLCALFVLWGHVSQEALCGWMVASLPLPECSAFVFFVISGFLAGCRIDGIKDVSSYYKKKANRFFPLYYSYLIVSVLVFLAIGQSEQILAPRLVWYLCLLPQVPFCSHTGILPLLHLWFIGSLVLFYGLFPLFAKVKSHKRIATAAIIAVIWLSFKLALRFFVGTDSFLYGFVRVTGLDILFAGVWAGLLWKEENSFFTKLKGLTPLSIIAWILFLFSGFYDKYIPAPVRADFLAVLALVIIITQQAESPFPNLEHRAFDWLGRISYEVYVIQFLVLIILARVYSRIGIEYSDFIIYFVCTAIVIGFAWCCNKVLAFLSVNHFNRKQ